MGNDEFFKDFNRSANRTFSVVLGIAILWVIFLVGAGSTLVWLAGRYLGAW